MDDYLPLPPIDYPPLPAGWLRLTLAEQSVALDDALRARMTAGARIVHHGPDWVTLAEGRYSWLVNIALWAATCGLWAPAALLLYGYRSERHVTLTVDGQGIHAEKAPLRFGQRFARVAGALLAFVYFVLVLIFTHAF